MSNDMFINNQTINLTTNRESLKRPAWTQDNLYAFRDKHTKVKGGFVIIKDYYIKSKGL